ncbi:hypothetical protein ACUNWD_05670 [Sunxiuqinia sp. A32]|uniref:hypothetical protein n=1 Tax=Sunxiuqinia sp. A32 TaxID=3461496 RepID=UPI004045CD76
MKEENEPYNEPPSILKNFMDDSFFDDEPEPVFVPEPKPEQKPVVKKTFEPLKREPIIKKTEPIKKKTPILLEEEPEQETRLGAIMKDFTLKKAVIYSEILDRKY